MCEQKFVIREFVNKSEINVKKFVADFKWIHQYKFLSILCDHVVVLPMKSYNRREWKLIYIPFTVKLQLVVEPNFSGSKQRGKRSWPRYNIKSTSTRTHNVLYSNWWRSHVFWTFPWRILTWLYNIGIYVFLKVVMFYVHRELKCIALLLHL